MSGKYHLTTYGCQMNKNDSERIVSLLNSLGLSQTTKADQADLIIINTCSVRASAENRIFGQAINWKKLRQKNPKLIVAITGCMPGRDKDGKLKARTKEVDLFFGIEELIMLPQWLSELNPDLLQTDFTKLDNYLQINPTVENNWQAFVTIQTGCDNCCTYCVVPFARGREKNRPVKEILVEIETLAKNGCKEVTLLGQVVNNFQASDAESFAKDNPFTKDHFAALLWEVNQIKGIERIHYTAPDPQYFSEEQVQALKLPKQLKFLHLPAQSGDDEILKKMNRKYSAKQYIDLVKRIREVNPQITLGTDLIVGFCGETDKQFANTLEMYKQCQFDISYHAMYSERSGTTAAKAFADDVTPEIKKERWQMIQDLMVDNTWKINQKFLNKTVSVLVHDYKDGVCNGWSREMKFVQFLGKPELIGKIVNISVTRPETWVLRGELK